MEKSVRVAVRVRPLSAKEKAAARPSVVAVAPKEHQVTVRKKTYTFDRVFGQYASQKDVFKGVVQSVVDEALAGFNCTVFAYGQTGTGKTHTIQGKLSPHDENAGIIPRSVNYIFDKLQATKSEYSVRVSFLQLYNEELKDLLGENKKDKPLRLMEDAKRGGVYCQNLEEVTTLTAAHVFELLEIGSKNRITAETLLNEQSSRSHCIFTIRIHSKESNIPGEEMIRSGTLNLVDLAGSECIGRSGARNVRAREAGNINQSLLTLGRVITALVDKHPHVPYRDSKLTRLLQESLGGRAMTTVIATLGPAGDCIDETMSTLDYAHRAKSIKNKPEANQRTTKHVLIKEYGLEIDALRSQLLAARAKDGIFLPPAQYAEMQDRLAWFSSKLAELEDELDIKTTFVAEVEEALESAKTEISELETKLTECQSELASTTETLAATEESLNTTEQLLTRTQAALRASEANTNELQSQAQAATKLYQQRLKEIATLQLAMGINKCTFTLCSRCAVARKDSLLAKNYEAAHAYADRASTQCTETSTALQTFQDEQARRMAALEDHIRKVSEKYETSLGDVATKFSAVRKDVAGLVQGVLAKVEAGNDSVHAEHDKQRAAQEVQLQAWLSSLGELEPLTEELTSQLNTLVSSSWHSVSAVTSQIAAECNAMRTGMQAYATEHKRMLDSLQSKLAATFREEATMLSADASHSVGVLHSTQETMRQHVMDIQMSLKAQLDNCLQSVLSSLSGQSDALENQATAAKNRFDRVLDDITRDVAAVQTSTMDQASRLAAQLGTTDDHVHKDLASGSTDAVESHASSVAQLHSSLAAQATANASAAESLLASQSRAQADRFNAATDWVASEFQRVEGGQTSFVAVHESSAKAVQGACQSWRGSVNTLASASAAHTSAVVDKVSRHDAATAEFVASVAADVSTGATPRKRQLEPPFPVFLVPAVPDPSLPEELGSPKRKLEALELPDLVGGSRLQPPKKYLKSTDAAQ
ncbi:kinesin-like protein [Achlya hypogyna]|uniref:Kinesin-like protein n=1 Tax=Achlya hypogyna TaxID=1202772 RepID=A0A1V9ZI37_ACHHY|nr:kinesin-like protein [Achlya hypogyna]